MYCDVLCAMCKVHLMVVNLNCVESLLDSADEHFSCAQNLLDALGVYDF